MYLTFLIKTDCELLNQYNTVVKCAAPGSFADQPSKPQAPPGAGAGAAGEPVLPHAATSAAGTNRQL